MSLDTDSRSTDEPAAQTSYAQLTPPGQGALATIAVWGPRAEAIVGVRFQPRSGRSLSEYSQRQVIYGHWRAKDDPGEDLIVVRLPDAIEVHAHASPAGLNRISRSLAEAGATRRSYADYLDHRNDRDFWKTECQLALIQAETRRTVRFLLRQLDLLPMAMRSLDPLAPATAGRPHDGKPKSTRNRAPVPSQQRTGAVEEEGCREAAIDEIEQMLAWSEFGLHLTRPWNVVLCGRPNVGKSSLINAICGFQRAIVDDRAGTTRDRLTHRTAIDGWPVRLTDTAGLRGSPADAIESEGIALARKAIQQADLVVAIFDASQPWTQQDSALNELVKDRTKRLHVFNKSDLPASLHRSLPDSFDKSEPGIVQVSARTGSGLEELFRRISQELIPRIPPPNQPFPVTVPQVDRLVSLLEPPS